MATTARSGIIIPAGTDNATREAFNINWNVIDKKLRIDYKEQIDVATYDAVAKIYTTISYIRPEDGTLYCKQVLSNKVGGNYLTDTWQIYDATGLIVLGTLTWTLAYDANGNIITKTPVVVGAV